MRKLLLFLLIPLLFGCAGPQPMAQLEDLTITFQWDANTEENLAGYRLYQSAVSGEYVTGPGNEVEEIVPLLPGEQPPTTVTITTLNQIWYWVLTAYDNEVPENESDVSNEVTSDKYDSPFGLQVIILEL